MMQLTIGIHKDTTGLVTGDQLDLIYRRCKDQVYGAPVTSQRVERPMPATPPRPSSSMAQESFHTPQRAPQSPVPSRTGSAPSTPGDRTLGPREVLPQDLAAWDAEVLDNGQQKGQTFRMVAETEQSYCNYLTGQHRAGKIKNAQLQEFAKYLATRSGTAMMAYMGPSSEDMLLCILDTGCNNTCHGAGWVARYTEMTGLCPELQPHHGRVRGVGGNVQVVGLRQIPVLFALKNGDIASGMITSTELSGSDAPLLLSTKAQRSLGLVIDTEEQTVFSKRMNNYLEIVDRDGLPAIRLIPSTEDRQDVALQVDYASEGDDSGNSSNETMSPNDTTATSPSSNATSDVDSNATEVDKTFIEEEDTLCYINLLQEPKKIMTKGQRKKMADSTEDLKKEDLALWGTLRQERGLRRPHRLLPHGCRCFILELFAGAAMVTALASSWGLPVGKPIDVTFDASHDLLKSANRTAAQAYIEEMDPFVVVAGPKCGPWSAWQSLNASKGPEYEAHIMDERIAWYPVFCGCLQGPLAKRETHHDGAPMGKCYPEQQVLG